MWGAIPLGGAGGGTASKIKNRRNALSKCSFVKFVNRKRISLKAVSNPVLGLLESCGLREHNKIAMH